MAHFLRTIEQEREAAGLSETGVPVSVTPFQARAALNAAGLREAVEVAVAAAPYEVRDAWEYALAIERDSPFVTAIGEALALTDEEIDALFRAAAEI